MLIVIAFVIGVATGFAAVALWLGRALNLAAADSEKAVTFFQRARQLFDLVSAIEARATYVSGIAKQDLARRRELADYERFVNRRIDYYRMVARTEGRELPPEPAR